ncbi:MAG: hypothetical protein O7F75_10250 [Alphaproteobacteria bacterium]|nr:hypothetical protein [Alphaproteobacteria bacterium]
MLEDIVAHPGRENVLLGMSGAGGRDEDKAGREQDACGECPATMDLPSLTASRRRNFERLSATAW